MQQRLSLRFHAGAIAIKLRKFCPLFYFLRVFRVFRVFRGEFSFSESRLFRGAQHPLFS